MIARYKEAGRRIYIAGPMTGIPEFNYPAFNQWASIYRRLGYEVFNPAEADTEFHGTDISKGNTTGSVEQAALDHGFDRRITLAHDLTWIATTATHIHMLRGWENSGGARAEHALAATIGLEICYE